MIRSGQEYIDGLHDGRSVYIDGERVDDVTTHPAFREAARSMAHLYDVATANPEVHAHDGGNVAYMIPRSEEDLVRRRTGLNAWAETSFGLLGRGPDHVAGFLAGFAAGADVFGPYADNVVRFHERARNEDLYLSYVIVPPQIDRSKPAHQQADPHLYAGVKEERDGGIVIKGAQMLGTGAALSDFVLLSSIVPLRPGDENYAISVVVPTGAAGLKIFSRRSYAAAASSVYDYPLATRFDETDALVVFDDVFVPWEHVFVYRDLDAVQGQWWDTPAHALGNNQAQIRLAVKLRFIAGLARAITEMNGVEGLPPVQGTLAELGALAATANGLVLAAEHNCVIDDRGVAWPGPAETFANMVLQSEMYPRALSLVRELCGGGLIQLPSSVEDFRHPETADIVDRYVQSAGTPSRERVKLLKLAWDIVGSEFAGRHHQYELFYAGAPFLVKLRAYRNFDFAAAKGLVERALAGYDLDGRVPPAPAVEVA